MDNAQNNDSPDLSLGLGLDAAKAYAQKQMLAKYGPFGYGKDIKVNTPQVATEAPLVDPGEELKKALGWGLEAAKANAKILYNKLPQGIRNGTTPILKGTYNAVEPPFSYVFNKIGEAPFRALTNTVKNVVSGKNPTENLSDVLKTPNSSDWHDVINSIPKGSLQELAISPVLPFLPEKVQNIVRNDIGMVANLVADPLNKLHIGGMTKAGDTALKAGTEAPSIASGLANGERALVTMGKVPIVPGSKLVGKGLQKTGDLINKIPYVPESAQGFKTSTNVPELNNALLTKVKNPMNEAAINAKDMEKADTALITQHANAMGIAPEELQRKVLNYIEPFESQNPPKGKVALKTFNEKIAELQKTSGADLPLDIKSMADRHIADYAKFNATEGGKTRSYYVEHNSTPQWNEFRNKWMPEIDDKRAEQINSAVHDAIKARGGATKGLTVNEVNNLFRAGQGYKVPGLEGMTFLKNFKDNMFDENAARIHAQRYLENAKVLSQKDFENHVEKTYGKPTNAYFQGLNDGSIKPGDYVKDPRTGSWYPKEVANSVQKMREMKTDTAFQKTVGRLWGGLNDATKKLYFGYFPASIGRIWLGNQGLAYMNGLWSLPSQMKGIQLAIGLRTGKLGAEDAKLLQTLKENRAYGMGMARYESPELADKGIGSKMWEAHNFVEDASRIGASIEAMRQGYNPMAAGKASRKALYDYSDSSEVDQKGKALAPFYTFQRKNIEGMLRNAVQNPARVGLPIKIQNEGSQDFQDQRKYWSDNKAEGTPLPIGEILNKGLGTNIDPNLMLHLNSLWPGSDINKWSGTNKDNAFMHTLKNLGAMINPFIRVPIEMASNYNLNAGTPIEKVSGQQASFGPFQINKRFGQYPLSNLRIVNDPMLPFDQKTPLWQALTRLGTGMSFHTANPENEKDWSDIENKLKLSGSHVQGMKDLPRAFGREAQRKYRSGDLSGAKAAYENEKISVQQLLDEAKQMKER